MLSVCFRIRKIVYVYTLYQQLVVQGRFQSNTITRNQVILMLQKGGVPAAPSGTATLLRLSPSY